MGKKCKYFLLSSIIIFVMSCGTTGHIEFYNFNVPKSQAETELLNAINSENFLHAIPEKWKAIYDDPGPIEYIYLYFSKNPEEMYEVSFTNKSEWDSSTNCQLGLVGVFDGDHWSFRNHLSRSEKKRMQERFENEILSKMKYSYYKSY